MRQYTPWQPASRTPHHADLPPGLFAGTAAEWEQLSPGMRREIVRTAAKLAAHQEGANDA